MNKQIYSLGTWFFKRPPLIIYFLWVCAYLWLIDGEHFQAYLQPKFKALLLLGMVVLMLFFLVAFLQRSSEEPHHDTKGIWLQGMFLGLPLIFLISVGDRTLGTYAFSKGSVGLVGAISEETIISGQKASQTLPENPNQLPSDKAETAKTTLTELLKGWKRYNGRKVITEGLVNSSEKVPKGYAYVFRFLIVCCAADAIPVGILVEEDAIKDFSDNDWVKIEGTFGLTTIKGKRAAFIHADNAFKLPSPSPRQQYLFQ